MDRILHLFVALLALLLAPAAIAQERGPVVLAAASLQESLTEAANDADGWKVIPDDNPDPNKRLRDVWYAVGPGGNGRKPTPHSISHHRRWKWCTPTSACGA